MSEVIVQQESPPQNAKCDDTVTPEKATYGDSSGTIFSMYITHAQNLDEDNVENWKGVADRILIFTGLFSATVAIFIAISYPNLQQDPNIITQSLLAQISQQLSNATANSASGVSNVSISYVPPGSVVFINSVWFLSLVLSLMCALLATFLQQWARRYLHVVRQNHPPHVRAHIREYFARGARRFHIFELVEVLPFLLLISMHLFFAGLVAFAFRANHTVAYFTTAIVGFCSLSYIALTLMPLIFHDCPYYTPLTSLLWFTTQLIPLSYFSFVYHCTKQWYDRWGADGESMVESFRDRYANKAKSFSEGMSSKLEYSAKRISMDIYKGALVRTLNWLNEDRELEEFVDGIPGLCESNAIATRDNGDTQRTIRDVLAALPGPTNFHPSLPWSIIHLAQRAFTNKLPKSVQKRRIRACLKALYYIPGAIRDVLAPYAAGEHHFSEILPLLNSPESLEVIDELWDTPNDDVALSVRCTAAVVAAFRITPRRTLDKLSTLDFGFIWDEEQFLTKRLRDDADPDGRADPEYHPRSDSARLQNIVRFLADVKNNLQYMNTQWWGSNNAELIRLKNKELLTMRRDRMGEHRTSHRKFDQQLEGDRTSPAFVPAAQQDLIALTLEILARGPIANAATLQHEAFRDAYTGFVQVAFTQARELAREQALGRPLSQTRVLSQSDQEVLAWIETQAADSIEMVKRALGPVTQSLQPQSDEMPAPHNDTSLSQVLVGRIAPATPSLPYSTVPSSAWREADAGEFGHSPV